MVVEACLLVFQAPAPISPLCCLIRLFGLTVNLQSQGLDLGLVSGRTAASLSCEGDHGAEATDFLIVACMRCSAHPM